jgi:hypothetical protein
MRKSVVRVQIQKRVTAEKAGTTSELYVWAKVSFREAYFICSFGEA